MSERVAVLGGDAGPGQLLSLGLEDAGSAVTTLGSRFASGDEVAGALGRARRELGGLDAVVDARVPPFSTRPGSVCDLDDDGWAARAEEPMRQVLFTLKGAHQILNATGGAVVLVLPTLAMSGAPGVVPWVTAAEGCRALAKVAARTWGHHGIRVNCLTVAADLLAATGDEDSGPGLDRPGLPEPAFGRRPDLRADVAVTLSAVLGPGFSAVTGLTLAVDGGVWMTP